MAQAVVHILETFEVIRQLGTLVVKTARTGDEDILDGPREARHRYEKDALVRFSNKKLALRFVAAHAGRAELV